MKKNAIVLAVAWLVFLALPGCLNPFSPPQKGMPDWMIVPLNDTPEKLIQSLEASYNDQDITLFKSLLAEDFIFVVSPNYVVEDPNRAGFLWDDVDNDGELEAYWQKEKEIRSHERLFRGVKEIKLDLSCPACRDSSEWLPWVDGESDDTIGIYIVIRQATLEITTKDGLYYALKPSTQKFGLKKDPSDTTLWLIGEWHDEG